MDKTKGHHGKDVGGEGQTLSSSQGDPDSGPSAIPDGDAAMVDAGNESHPVRETRDKEMTRRLSGSGEERMAGLGAHLNTTSVVAVEESMEVDNEDQINSTDDDPNKLWCLCRQPCNNRFMICCDICDDWFHGECVNVTNAQGIEMELNNIQWNCPKCAKLGKESEGGTEQQQRRKKSQERTVNSATRDNENRNYPAAGGSKTMRQINAVFSQSGESNQGKSGEPKPGPSFASAGERLLSQRLTRNKLNTVNSLLEQSINGIPVGHDVIQPEFYERLQLTCRTVGHRRMVFCVLFDVTGKFIFTGATDGLVKIWSAVDGRLLATLRAAAAIIKLAVNHPNTLIAAGTCEKLIRVWCLRTCAPITVLRANGNVSSLHFCPIPRSRHPVAYLMSTTLDGWCSFWGFTENRETGLVEFRAPIHHQEVIRPGREEMTCSSFSPGGIFMAAGSGDNHVRVYHMLGEEGPERILQVEAHTGRVECISWAHEGLKFISGSKDGTALVWRFDNGDVRYVRLFCAKVLESTRGPNRRLRVTNVAWNTDDTLILTAASDCLVKVWNPLDGELIRILERHNDEFYVIESHPFNPRIICTAGYDGKVIIWDIGTLNKEEKGKVIFQHYNKLDQGHGHGVVFNCKLAPDGLSLAATDSHGHLLIFTTQIKANSKFAKLPKEIFFHTDYLPITINEMTNEVLDELTQVPPYLMETPVLVDVRGTVYPVGMQMLVPRRETDGVGVLQRIGQGGDFHERNVIMPLSKGELARSEEKRLGFAEMEETLYNGRRPEKMSIPD